MPVLGKHEAILGLLSRVCCNFTKKRPMLAPGCPGGEASEKCCPPTLSLAASTYHSEFPCDTKKGSKETNA